MFAATALFILGLKPGFVLVEDNVVVEIDGSTDMTRRIGSDSANETYLHMLRLIDEPARQKLNSVAPMDRNGSLCRYLTEESAQYSTCAWNDKILRLTKRFGPGKNSPARMKGMSARTFEFNLALYLDATPPISNRNLDPVHTVRLSMPGNWLHRFGCIVDSTDTPVMVEMDATHHVPPRCAQMPKRVTLPPPDAKGYIYEGSELSLTYTERPKWIVASEMRRSWMPGVTFGGLATLVLLVLAVVIPKYLAAIKPKRPQTPG